MHYLKSVSVSKKLIIALIGTAVIATVLLTVLSVNSTSALIKAQLEENELPSTLARIAGAISQEISQIESACAFIAQDPVFLDWLDRPEDKRTEALLIERLKKSVTYFNVDTASFADRKTHRYWNTDGFLRILNQQQDAWFFEFISSGKSLNQSLYTETDGTAMLFVNYQEVNGRGLAGIGKEAGQWRSTLLSETIRDSGFVYIIDQQGRVILHPNADLIGQADLQGLYGDSTANAINATENFFFTEIKKNREAVILASLGIEHTEWTLVAEIPRNEVYAAIDQSRTQLAVLAAAVICGVTLLAWWLSASISGPIQHISKAFKALGEGDGDLSTRLRIDNHKELIELAEGFNTFVEKIDLTVAEVRKTSIQLHEQAQKVTELVNNTQQKSKVQKDHSIQVATSIKEVEITIQEIAKNASSAASAAEVADVNTRQGVDITQRTKTDIIHLHDNVADVAKVIGSLVSDISSIGETLSVINSISDQTNLLALNAAIEAARAGEQGRGFSVVADEVRHLAQRTRASTQEIEQLITKLTEQSSNAERHVISSTESSEDTVNSMAESDTKLQQISSEIMSLKAINEQVAVATEEQATMIRTVSSNIHEIQDISSDTLGNTEQLLGSCDELVSMATQLDLLVQGFKQR